MYRMQGRAGCDLPNVRTIELNTIVRALIEQIEVDQQAVMELVWQGIQQAEHSGRRSDIMASMQRQLAQVQQKKEKLLELSAMGLLTNEEFKEQNDRLNEQRTILYAQQKENEAEQKREQTARNQLIQAMQEELCGTLHEQVAAAFLEQAVICADSTKERIHLQLRFGLGQQASVYFSRKPFAFCSEICSQYAQPNAGCAQ